MNYLGHEHRLLVDRLIPAIPPTLKALQSCDERNSSEHLYGCNRPGVFMHGGPVARVFDGPVFVADQKLYARARRHRVSIVGSCARNYCHDPLSSWLRILKSPRSNGIESKYLALTYCTAQKSSACRISRLLSFFLSHLCRRERVCTTHFHRVCMRKM